MYAVACAVSPLPAKESGAIGRGSGMAPKWHPILRPGVGQPGPCKNATQNKTNRGRGGDRTMARPPKIEKEQKKKCQLVDSGGLLIEENNQKYKNLTLEL